MSKGSRPASRARQGVKVGWPLVVYVWMVSVGFLSYFVVRIALDAYPHPVHWLGGLGGAFVGWAVGWLWYRLRGDIV
jgi:hypothetical protein